METRPLSSRSLTGTKVMQAVQEILEDRSSDVVKHCQDPYVVEGKPNVITLKIEMTPNKSRSQYTYKVSDSTKLAPREAAESTLFTTIDKTGTVEFVEFAPVNQLPFLVEEEKE